MWPLLGYFIDVAAPFDSNVAEKVVRLTKHTWRCTYDTFEVTFLTEVLKKFIESFKTNPYSSYIYAIEIIATVFSNFPEY